MLFVLCLLLSHHPLPSQGGEEARRSPFDEIHDTDAYIAANDNLIVVVFRGTMGVDDWYTNAMLKPKPCPAEWGIPPPGGTVHTVRSVDLFEL